MELEFKLLVQYNKMLLDELRIHAFFIHIRRIDLHSSNIHGFSFCQLACVSESSVIKKVFVFKNYFLSKDEVILSKNKNLSKNIQLLVCSREFTKFWEQKAIEATSHFKKEKIC